MKNILNKVSIHPLTYFFAFSACITGFFQSLIVLMIIIGIHELGHIIVSLRFNYEIKKIEFWPFGGITKIEKDVNSPISNEIALSVAGIVAQVILGFLIFILYKFNLIRYQFYSLFTIYNKVLILFNLLPIASLDGYQLLKSVLEYFTPYKKAFIISIFVSILSLFLFIIYNFQYAINNYLIIAFLTFKIIETIKNFKYMQLRFFLERIIKNYKYSKIKIINGINVDNMFKEKTHYFIKDNKYLNEYDILAKKFDIKQNIW